VIRTGIRWAVVFAVVLVSKPARIGVPLVLPSSCAARSVSSAIGGLGLFVLVRLAILSTPLGLWAYTLGVPFAVLCNSNRIGQSISWNAVPKVAPLHPFWHIFVSVRYCCSCRNAAFAARACRTASRRVSRCWALFQACFHHLGAST